MTRFSMLAVVAVAALTAACAGTQSTETSTGATATQGATQTAPATQTASYTDAQLRAYIAANAEIEPLQAGLAAQTPEQQAQTRTQIAAILQRNGLPATQFNGIARMANEDRTFAARLAALVPDTFADDTLRAFAAASVEIEPITRSLATATPEQREQGSEQIRQILARNSLDIATYNAIAARAQADPAFAARIAALHNASPNG